jgi:predicted acyltransferase (DUF342 family)
MADGKEEIKIRAHKASNTLIIPRNTNYAKPIVHRVNVIAGINSRILEHISIEGNLELGKAARVMGNVKANDVTLGPSSLIMGDLTVNGDLLALDNAKVAGRVTCAGSATTRPGVAFGSFESPGMIEVHGKKPAKNIKAKVVVKKEDK